MASVITNKRISKRKVSVKRLVRDSARKMNSKIIVPLARAVYTIEISFGLPLLVINAAERRSPRSLDLPRSLSLLPRSRGVHRGIPIRIREIPIRNQEIHIRDLHGGKCKKVIFLI